MRPRRGPGCGCLGCGGGSLLVLALLGAAAWFVVVQPVRQFLAQLNPPQTQSQTATQNQSPSQNQTTTQNQTTAPLPTSSATAAPLTAADVQKFVRIRRDVRAALGQSFTQLQTTWADVQAGQSFNVLTVLNVLRQAGGSVGPARVAQSAGLARENMTPQRYAEVRAGVNRALGVPNVDFAQAAQSLQNGQLPNLDAVVQTATAREKQLVAPFQKELETTAAAGLLGL
ncbi:hypothetical protein [Deinococcus arenicola]|uniref:DUF4142 domain-containing protein n=1 Tax=Deinococcus arenicola TaxID=2994950 RepID=A0ABU4DKP9_9DEIO|nr:hypothetical protein [Deinococcus sp. ZS9-10]MDV6373008.1 hypothetical protein [Deinococcus sp. ZS9-10]